MYLKKFQKSKKAPPTIPCKPILDLDISQNLKKYGNFPPNKINVNIGKQKNTLVMNNQLLTLERQLKQTSQNNKTNEQKLYIIPRTEIFLIDLNADVKTQKHNHKKITLSTKNNSLHCSDIKKRENLSPTKTSPSKWKNHRKTPSCSLQTSQTKQQQICSSPIKKYLKRFKQIIKQTQEKHIKVSMEIEDILFKNIK